MVGEDEIVKLVVDEFCRRVVVALYLVANHLHFLVYLGLRIGAVEHDVGEQVYGPRQMVFQNGCVVDGVFLVGEGIQVAPHALQTVEHVPGPPPGGAFESDMLAKVGQSLLTRKFVARARIDFIAAVDHLRIALQVNDSQAVI